LVAAVCWGSWRERNDQTSRDRPRSLDDTITRIISYISFWIGIASSDTAGKARLLLGNPSKQTSSIDPDASTNNGVAYQGDGPVMFMFHRRGSGPVYCFILFCFSLSFMLAAVSVFSFFFIIL